MLTLLKMTPRRHTFYYSWAITTYWAEYKTKENKDITTKEKNTINITFSPIVAFTRSKISAREGIRTTNSSWHGLRASSAAQKVPSTLTECRSRRTKMLKSSEILFLERSTYCSKNWQSVSGETIRQKS